MDSSEMAIINLLKRKSLVTKKELFTTMGGYNVDDVKEAVISLEKQGYLVKVSPIGDESYSITKKGLSL